MLKAISLLGLWALSACTAVPVATHLPAGRNLAVRETIDYPEIGSVAQAGIGEDILRQGTFTEVRGIELAKPNKIDAYSLSAGFYPQIAEDERYTYHSYRVSRTTDGYGYIPPARDLLDELLMAPAAIRVAKHKQETCVIVRDLLSTVCDTEYPYRRLSYRHLTQSDLQQKLIYRGRIGDRILIGYSEESGHYARPRSSKQAQYDLGRGDEITYKGARIKVLDADGKAIRYKVLSRLTGW
jgi:hypothetical protein